MNIINGRIRREYCAATASALKDENLMHIYEESKSVKARVQNLEIILSKYVDEETRKKIVSDYLCQLIPPGTKGAIRGKRFNDIVKAKITELNLNPARFEVKFETKCAIQETNEIPDWYILEKETKKVLIGMNQLDLWSGGQQLNRGFKYLDQTEMKIICVVCNFIKFKNTRSKSYKLFELGYKNNTLTYLNNLHNIILAYFNPAPN